LRTEKCEKVSFSYLARCSKNADSYDCIITESLWICSDSELHMTWVKSHCGLDRLAGDMVFVEHGSNVCVLASFAGWGAQQPAERDARFGMPDYTTEQSTGAGKSRRKRTAVMTAEGDITTQGRLAKPRRGKAAAQDEAMAPTDVREAASRSRRTNRTTDATAIAPRALRDTSVPAHLAGSSRPVSPATLSLPAIPHREMEFATGAVVVPEPDVIETARGTTGRRRAVQPPEQSDVAPAKQRKRAGGNKQADVEETVNRFVVRSNGPLPDVGAILGDEDDDLTMQRNLPAVIPTTEERQIVSPGNTDMLPAVHKDATIAPYDLTIIPGTQALSIHDTAPVRAPRLHVRARKRVHRVVLIVAASLILMAAITFVPLAQAKGSPLAQWLSGANAFAIPTPTATPVPLYPSHPYVSGEHSFVCVALPFARLAQQKMIDEGMSHPWYVSVMLAQWGVEQGWTLPGYTGYNWGNVSGVAGYPAIGGLAVAGSPSSFAYAYTPMQGLDEYTLFTRGGYYAGVTAAYPRGPVAQAIALGESPWDAAHYGGAGRTLLGVMSAFDLQRFDNPSARC
jgi:hypothetical protein